MHKCGILRAVLLLFVLLIGSRASYAQWTSPASGTADNLNEITLVSGTTSVAVGNNGIIVRSTDSGVTWNTVGAALTSADLNGVDSNGSAVIAIGRRSGPNSTIGYSTDSGATWSSSTIAADPSNHMVALAFSTASIAVTVGNSGTMLRTTDGGANWTDVTASFQSLVAIEFNGATGVSVGLSGGGTSTIFRTADNGATWAGGTVAADPILDLSDVAFLNATTLVAVGELGYILRSTDGGLNWSIVGAAVTVNNLNDVVVDANDPTRLLAVGDLGTILRSTDSGATWAVVGAAVTANALNSVAFDGTTALAVGASGTIVRSTDSGATWATEASSTANTLNDVAVNSSVSLTVGASGTIRKEAGFGGVPSPLISLSPATLAYGNVAVSSPSVLALAVQNTGTADLIVSNITSNDGQFVPALTSFTVTAGSTTNVNITFTPSSAGAKAGTLTVTHNATGSPSAVPMTGTGVEPVISLSPATLAYGNVGVSSPSVLVLAVQNTGTADLIVSNITSNDGQFVPALTSFTVTAGNTTNVNVTFTPASVGAKAGTLTVTHNATGSPSAVPMTGTGLDPAIGVSPASLDFGNVDLSSSDILTLTVSNSGTLDLIVSNITSDDGQFAPDITSFTVSSGSDQAVNITFTPTAPGTQTGTLTITHNGADSPTTVALSGDATVVVSSTTIDFGIVEVGTSVTKTLDISNPSGTPINITNVSSTLADFASDQSVFSVAAAGSQTLVLTFAPTQSGGQSATLSITHNPTITVTLVGSTPIKNVTESSSTNAKVRFEVPWGHQYLLSLLLPCFSWCALKRRTLVGPIATFIPVQWLFLLRFSGFSAALLLAFGAWELQLSKHYIYLVSATSAHLLNGIGLLHSFDTSGLAQGFCALELDKHLFHVTSECTGYFALSVYLGGVALYAAPGRRKLWGWGLGSVAFFAYSVLRIAILGLIAQWLPAWFEPSHTYLMVVLNLGFVCFLWSIWVQYWPANQKE